MNVTGKKKPHRKVEGILLPGALLTKDGMMRAAGLGRNSIDRGEEEGALNPLLFAGRYFYESDEVIAWIRKTGKRIRKAKARKPQKTRGAE